MNIAARSERNITLNMNMKIPMYVWPIGILNSSKCMFPLNALKRSKNTTKKDACSFLSSLPNILPTRMKRPIMRPKVAKNLENSFIICWSIMINWPRYWVLWSIIIEMMHDYATTADIKRFILNSPGLGFFIWYIRSAWSASDWEILTAVLHTSDIVLFVSFVFQVTIKRIPTAAMLASRVIWTRFNVTLSFTLKMVSF